MADTYTDDYNLPLPMPVAKGYATPQQIEAARQYSKYLLAGGGQQPVKHWTQGLSNMVSALVGGYGMYNAGQQDIFSRQLAGSQIGSNPYVDQETSGQGVTSSPRSFGPTSSVAPTSMDANQRAIGSIEANSYSELGPVTRTGDRAYGKYQVMGANIPQWTQEILGKRMTPQEFLNDKGAQDKVFKGKFAQYVAKTGNANDAASMWFTGKPLAQGANLKDQLGTTGTEYVRRFNAAGGGQPQTGAQVASLDPTAGVPNAQNNAPVGTSGPVGGTLQPPDAPTQVAAALKGGAGPVAPIGQPTQPVVDPRLLPRQPHPTRQQMEFMFGAGAPYMNEKMQELMMGQYYGYGQPIQMPHPFGTVLYDPVTHTQQFIGNTMNREVKSSSGATHIDTYQYDEQGVLHLLPTKGGETGGEKPAEEDPDNWLDRNTPAKAPGPQGALTPPATSTMAANPMGALANMPSQGASPTSQKLASLETGVGSDASPSMLSAPPPAPQAPAGGTKLADYQSDLMRRLDAEGIQYRGSVTAAEEMSKKAVADYMAEQATARNIAAKVDQTEYLKQLTYDPNFMSAIKMRLGGDQWNQLKAQFGDDPNANRASELFDKILNGEVLQDLKMSTQGMGQIRLAELQVVQRSLANREMTQQGMRAALDIMINAQKRELELADLQNKYVKEKGVQDVTGWNRVVQRYLARNPIITDDLKKSWEKETGVKLADVTGSKGGPLPPGAGPTVKPTDLEDKQNAINILKRLQGK